MRVVMFYHSLVSDWNHGNAHFLRGVVSELRARGHDVRVYEPRHGWSVAHLLEDHGPEALDAFHRAYPGLQDHPYEPRKLNLYDALHDADLVIVHEWNEHELVARIGDYRARVGRFRLLFHDTHHRSVTDPAAIARYDLAHYDGVLAFGSVVRDLYLRNRWASAAWTWHEAADTRVFYPRRAPRVEWDLAWVGNWGDDERTAELHEFLLHPVQSLGIKAIVYGVRYPPEAVAALRRAGITYGGWLPNFDVPKLFALSRLTIHIPRRPYTQALPGIPTIRPFEAMACAIPLVCAPWNDCEHLFEPQRDYLIARDGEQMTRHIEHLLQHPRRACAMAQHARETIVCRHTCAHRVSELSAICHTLGMNEPKPEPGPAPAASDAECGS